MKMNSSQLGSLRETDDGSADSNAPLPRHRALSLRANKARPIGWPDLWD
uniref:Uncharacterized protein n=1 Tax=Anguilla anguilla TaxID=7936 RepID=A0A0E9RI24_ANGAN